MDTHITITKELRAYGLHISTSQSHHTKLHYVCMALVKVSRLTETPDHEDSIKDFIAYGAVYKTVLDAVQDESWDQ